MTIKKEREQEIITISPNRRPYGVRLALLLEASTKFNIHGDCVLLTSQNYIIRLVPSKTEPDTLRLPHHQCWDILVEGFSTAGEAEKVGLKVALGLYGGPFQGNLQPDFFTLHHFPVQSTIEQKIKV